MVSVGRFRLGGSTRYAQDLNLPMLPEIQSQMKKAAPDGSLFQLALIEFSGSAVAPESGLFVNRHIAGGGVIALIGNAGHADNDFALAGVKNLDPAGTARTEGNALNRDPDGLAF